MSGDEGPRNLGAGIKAMRKYLAIIEKASDRNWSGYFPDLPGCIATGKTLKQCHKNLTDALQLHLSGMDAAKLPKPMARGVEVEAKAS